MPGSEKVQPARQSWRIQGGQDTVERHGGLDVVMEKTVHWEQETPTSNGREMIDDFRLRGSRTWRHMGGHLSKEGWRTEVVHEAAHDFDKHNAPLSEGKALAVVVQAGARESALDKGWCGLPKSAAVTRRAVPRLACPRLARRVVAPHGRGRKW